MAALKTNGCGKGLKQKQSQEQKKEAGGCGREERAVMTIVCASHAKFLCMANFYSRFLRGAAQLLTVELGGGTRCGVMRWWPLLRAANKRS